MTGTDSAAHDPGSSREDPAALMERLGNLSQATRKWLGESLELALLDGQLAGVSLVRMFIYGVIAVFLFITGWLGLMFAMSIALHRMGAPLELVILIVAIASVSVGIILLLRISRLSANLTFRSTREQISPSGGGESAENAIRAKQ